MATATVVGASGYLGGELLRILVNHPGVDEIIPTSRKYAGKPVSSLHRNLYRIFDADFRDLNLEELDSDVVFFAAPPGEWFSAVPRLLGKGVKVITLGGKFRIGDAKLDQEVYGGYVNEDLLRERVYGLPELYRAEIRKARFVTNPGCYPVSVILAVSPLSKFTDSLDLKRIVVNSISGTSGAGAAPSEFLHHPETCNTVKPYNLLFHRHMPEIRFILEEVFGEDLTVSFTPSVVDMSRGIMSYVTVFSQKLGVDLVEHFNGFYGKEPFVRVLQGKKESIPSLCSVIGTNFCDVGVNYDDKTGRILVLSAIDNLIKGGSGQAVQNMNLMLGFDERSGLKLVAGHP
jgi:N-acetyl-gamma-glutamyl-phosphate reductase